MSNILENKTVIVTGGSSGIGRAIALAAARHGAKAVIVSDIVETPREGGEPTAAEIERLGGKANSRKPTSQAGPTTTPWSRPRASSAASMSWS